MKKKQFAHKMPWEGGLSVSVVLRTLRSLSTRHKHSDIVPIQQDLVQPGHPAALAGALVLHHIVQHHVDEVIEAKQGAHNLLVVLHDYVYPGADGLVHQFKGQKGVWSSRSRHDLDVRDKCNISLVEVNQAIKAW